MKYAMETQDGEVVITPKKSLEGGPDTFEIKDEVKGKLADGQKKFVLDLDEASFVNSTGIGVVVAIQFSVKNAGGEFKVCRVSDRARRAFVVTGVWSLFDVYEDLDSALRSFS